MVSFFNQMLGARVTNIEKPLCGIIGKTYVYFGGAHMYTRVDKIGLPIYVPGKNLKFALNMQKKSVVRHTMHYFC